MENNNQESLMDFVWDDNEGFFDTPEEKKEESKKTEEKKEEETQDVEEVIEEIQDSKDEFFEEDENTSEENTNPYKEIYSKLKDKGVLNIDLEEDEELDEDKFIELQEQEIDERVDETLKGFFEELPEEGAAYLKFIKAGGNSADFFEALKRSSSSYDIKDEKGQEKFLRDYHKTVDSMDDEDIDDKIEWYKDRNALAKYAEKYKSKQDAEAKKELDKLQKEAEARAEELQKQREIFVSTLKQSIDESDEIKGWNISKKDKKELHSFLTKATVKYGNNKYRTGFQDALGKALQDKDKLILLGKILQSDFNLDDIKKEVETKVVKKTKEIINKKESSSGKIGGGSSNKGSKSLSDYF